MAKRNMPEKIVDTPEVTPEVATEEAVVIGSIVVTDIRPITGIVSGCKKLNIRKKPSKAAEVKTEANANTKLEIDMEKSTDEWYKVRTESGVSGFCMKKFVTIK